MKKQQVIYIFIAIFLILAFLFMLTNTTTYNPGFDSYAFQHSLANSAAMAEGMTATVGPEASTHANPTPGKKTPSSEMPGMPGMPGMPAIPGMTTNTFTTHEGMAGLKMAPVENQFQTIVPYLDNARGPQCAGTSNGVTATGGPLCLTSDQQKAMASRGGNSELNNCKPYNM
jgi:hypothetical protein